MDSSVSPKDKIWFLGVCHHISNAVYLCVQMLKEYIKLSCQLLGNTMNVSHSNGTFIYMLITMPIKISWSDKEALMGLFGLSLPQTGGGTLNNTGNECMT